jgi:hypothetical protein
MKNSSTRSSVLTLFILILTMAFNISNAQSDHPTYTQLKKGFLSPDYSYWGEVPLWWWEADSLDKKRITWQLEALSAKGVKAVCPIQRSPARCYPESFSKEWWVTIAYVNKECQRLGMRLWVYDQLGYGQYGWFEKAAAQVGNTGTSQIQFESIDVGSADGISMQMPKATLLEVRAYPLMNNSASDENSIDLSAFIQDGLLDWKPSEGEWKVAISTITPYQSFYMNESSTDLFLDQLYQRIEDVVGEDAMGNSLIGVFQDEHPPTPRNIYTPALAQKFKTEHGYDMARAIPALFFDVGDKTPKYRMDYLDTYLSLVEDTYWEKVYNWTAEKNLLTSHDNWGRNNIYRHSEGYIDYFRTQRWYSAPGLDDWRQKPIEERNYYDTKVASSIARLYNRPRVWAEVFHTSGWGRTPDQTLSWLSALYAFGANLYDEHGLYYSLNAGTWEHAAGDPHWRQPYWEYYQDISDWVTRMSYIMSQGNAVVDIAVHYPVVSVLSDIEKSDDYDYNNYMKLSRLIYNQGMDNDIIDDESILKASVENGRLKINGNEYRALVFEAERTIRLSILEKALELAQSGGVVLFYGKLPTASAENGKNDGQLAELLKKMLNTSSLETGAQNSIEYRYESGGYAAFIDADPELIPAKLREYIDRDFVGKGGDVYYSHRQIGDLDAYLVQNIEDMPIQLDARFRVDGVPELWDAFTGEITKVKNFERKNGYTHTRLTLEGNVAKLMVFTPGDQKQKGDGSAETRWKEKEISEDWKFSLLPTCDNIWGDFRWPPSNEKIGPENREFKYKEETHVDGAESGWNKPEFDDENWEKTLYSTGPYWLALEEIPENADIIKGILKEQNEIENGDELAFQGVTYNWKKISYSQKLGLAKPSPWGGHSGYPDGHFDKNFIQLREGRKLLFTRIYSPVKRRAGLNIQLRNSATRLWVNGNEEPVLGAVGNLPLNKGYNAVLLDVKDGTGGMLYVQKTPPGVSKLGEARTDITQPELDDASWIWMENSEGAYFRKSFNVDRMPETANVIVTGVSGFRLFVNGSKVDDDIGPWATWDYPKSVDIKPYLREGKNVFTAWGQFYKGINVSYTRDYQGFILAMKAIDAEGNTLKMVTDKAWKGSLKEFDGWENLDFDDSDWEYVNVKGKATDKPWGEEYLKNMGGSTTPYRPLSVNLSSPYIQVFDEMPDIVYDVKSESAKRVGWYRFEAPPGTKEIILRNDNATVWINGKKATVYGGVAKIEDPPSGVSQVAVRVNMLPGEYAGAAFKDPVQFRLEGGMIQPGLWSDYALPTYAGIGIYKQDINLDEGEADKQIELDLGEVCVAAEVFVNGISAGSRVAVPHKFDLTGLVKTGKNEIEVRVANTLAPHYSIPSQTNELGPAESGLIGPVQLKIALK